MTEQGETIAQKYANLITATYNLELLLAGVTATTLKHQEEAPEDKGYKRVMEQLTRFSQEAYQGLLKGENFIQFWSATTPIDALEMSSIGSRPARRTGKRSMEDLRAIPWVFSWNQARYYLPGWYGLGSALRRLREEDAASFALLSEKVQSWPLLRNSIYNVETSLASAHLGIMKQYAELVEDTALRNHYYNVIATEYRATEDMIEVILKGTRAERRPRMIKTLGLREVGLDRLHGHQIALLKQWRAAKAEGNDKRQQELLPNVLLSVNAIAAGLRTTG
jgi:phosphoenolpyruvate carboxylase